MKHLLLLSTLLPFVASDFAVLDKYQLYYNRGGDAGLEEAITFCSAIGGETPHDLTKEVVRKLVDSSVLRPKLPSPYQFFWLNGFNASEDGKFRWNATGNLIDDSLWAKNEPSCSDDNVCRVTIESSGQLYAEPEDRRRGVLCHVNACQQEKRLTLRINLHLIRDWRDRRGIEHFLDKIFESAPSQCDSLL